MLGGVVFFINWLLTYRYTIVYNPRKLFVAEIKEYIWYEYVDYKWEIKVENFGYFRNFFSGWVPCKLILKFYFGVNSI